MIELPAGSLLVRTWFGSDEAWRALTEAVETENEDGFRADVQLVDDRQAEGMTPDQLRAATPDAADGPLVSFLADEQTLTSSDQPVIALSVWQSPDEDEAKPEFRVIAAELWNVENNINLANMDWEDYTGSLDDQGIFRGF